MTLESLRRTAAPVILVLACAAMPLPAPSLFAAPAPASAPSSAVNLILVNGTVLTMNPQGMIAQAVAVSGDRIVEVGQNARIRSLAGPSTQVIDLEGRTLVPGFIDARVLGPFGFWELLLGVSLVDDKGTPAGSPEDVERLIKAGLAAKKPQPGAWVVAAGFNPRMPQVRKLKRDLADRACPDNPLLVLSLDHHVALLNGKAIERLGLKGLQFPDGSGDVDLDATGEPTGLVREAPVFLVMNKVWESLPDAVRRAATAQFVNAATRFGLTTAGFTLASPVDAQDAEALLKEGDLSLRAVLQPLSVNLEASRALGAYAHDKKSPDPDQILVGPEVRMLDGTSIGGGAALFQAYSDARWTSGLLTMTPEGLDTVMTAWASGQKGATVEASGSLASHLFLDATERAVRAQGAAPPGRPVMRVDGLELVSATDRARLSLLAQAGVVVTLQPTLFPYRIFMANALGDAQMQQAMPYKALVDAGVPVALGSDWPMSSQTFQPTQIMEWAITRTGWRAEEGLSREQALKGCTADAARALGMESRVGSIEAGKKADFVVLDRDPLDPAVPTDALSDIAVRMTIRGGEVVYENRGTDATARRRPAAATPVGAGGR
ncbi:MAG TPA: amidohydrolase family protein [Patescibacteria group bacterium]|nr:amidohydrolase family protein [Patescibacteria group bacterium]